MATYKAYLTDNNCQWKQSYEHIYDWDNEQVKIDYIQSVLMNDKVLSEEFEKIPNNKRLRSTSYNMVVSINIHASVYSDKSNEFFINKNNLVVKQTYSDNTVKYYWYFITDANFNMTSGTVTYNCVLDIFFTYNIRTMFKGEAYIEKAHYDRFDLDVNKSFSMIPSHHNYPLSKISYKKIYPQQGHLKISSGKTWEDVREGFANDVAVIYFMENIQGDNPNTPLIKTIMDVHTTYKQAKTNEYADKGIEDIIPMIWNLLNPNETVLAWTTNPPDGGTTAKLVSIQQGEEANYADPNGDKNMMGTMFDIVKLGKFGDSFLGNSAKAVPMIAFYDYIDTVAEGYTMDLNDTYSTAIGVTYRKENGDNVHYGAVANRIFSPSKVVLEYDDDDLTTTVNTFSIDQTSDVNYTHETQLYLSTCKRVVWRSYLNNQLTLKQEECDPKTVPLLEQQILPLAEVTKTITRIKSYLYDESKDTWNSPTMNTEADTSSFSIKDDKWIDYVTTHNASANMGYIEHNKVIDKQMTATKANQVMSEVGKGINVGKNLLSKNWVGAAQGIGGMVTSGISYSANMASQQYQKDSLLYDRMDIQEQPNKMLVNANNSISNGMYSEILGSIYIYDMYDMDKIKLGKRLYMYGVDINQLEDITTFINSRYWFNYIQVTDVYENITVQLSDQVKQIIEQRLQGGMTIWHIRVDSGSHPSARAIKDYSKANVEIAKIATKGLSRKA